MPASSPHQAEGTLTRMKHDQHGISRRGFVRGSVVGSAGLGAPVLLPLVAANAAETGSLEAAGSVPGTSFTDQSAALTPDRTVATACQFCNSNCRLNVDLKADRILAVRGEDDDPVQNGQLCVKAEMMPQLVYNKDRLTTPLRRVSGKKGSANSKFEAISWDEAYRTIARKLLHLRDTGQVHTIANRTTGRMPRGTGSLVARLFAMLGSPNNTDVGPVCNDAGANALAATFGLGNFTNGYGTDGATGKDDLGSARHYLFLGTNQAETHPVTFDYLLRGRKKTKATLTVVDPASPRPEPPRTGGWRPNPTPTSPCCWPCSTTSSNSACTTRRSSTSG